MINKILKEMPAYESFSYWFSPVDNNPGTWIIFNKEDLSTVIGTIDNNGKTSAVPGPDNSEPEINWEAVSNDMEQFKLRPEFDLLNQIDGVNTMDQEALVHAYCKKLLGIIMIKAARAGKNPDTNVKGATSAVEWLQTTDFFVAPASTRYHDSVPSGLLRHSLRVYNHIMRLKNDDAFLSVPVDSAALVALVHDWCKIGLYESYTRNVKNEQTGQWEKVAAYQHKQKGVPLGHGVSSMFLASKFFRLTTDESIAIRWHMGKWNVADNEVNELQLANESYPLVHLVQFADCLSITKYGN